MSAGGRRPGDPESIQSLADERQWLANRWADYKADEVMDARLRALPIRVRLEAGRRANSGESLVAVVTELEQQLREAQ